jgi:ankyrin repeat protein
MATTLTIANGGTKRKACDEIDTLFNKHLRMDPILYSNFMDACKYNDLKKLNEYLKDQTINPHMVDDKGRTPLIIAIISNSKQAAMSIIKCKNSNFNHLDYSGNNAIYYAAINKKYDLVKMMLKIPNIKIDSLETEDLMKDPRINQLVTLSRGGQLKSFKFNKFNPREIDEGDKQRMFRADLIKHYGGCMITGAKPDDCDYIHICNPNKNKLEPYEFHNGLIISKIFYRQYYKKSLIKFNVDNIRQIDEFTIGVNLITAHPEIMEFNQKEIQFHINSMKYFMNNKPKPTYKKCGNFKNKKKNYKMNTN